MREAIGGTWLFGIVILFIALFASFLAYSISYTRAFNVKNEIINLIERNEGFSQYSPEHSPDDVSGTVYKDNLKNLTDEELLESKNVEAQIYYKIKKSGYNYSAAETIDCTSVGHVNQETKDGGYCLTKYCQNVPDEKLRNNYSVYYKITTFISLRLPVVDITFNIPISGETRTIYYDTGTTSCDKLIGE